MDYLEEDFEIANNEIRQDVINTKNISYLHDAFRRFKKNKSSIVAFVVLLLIVFFSLFGPMMTKNSAYNTDSRVALLPPRIPLLEKMGIANGTKEFKEVYVEYVKSQAEVSYDDEKYKDYFFLEFIEEKSKPYKKTYNNISYEFVDLKYNLYEALKTPYLKTMISKDELLEYENKEGLVEIIRVYESSKGEKYEKYDVILDPMKIYNYGNGPYYLFGTNLVGQDLWSRVWLGTRVSLLIGFLVAVVTIIIGVIWGSISGYYGGKVDIIMERFVEVLGGIPWIVIMTIAVLYLGNGIRTLALALVLTSWIGTASMVRAQIYRYKNREYVLASKILGASDFRLIFKHILPNAIGSIITGTVLIIPSAIFMEATISYLGLGISGVSIGNLLSNGQAVGLVSYPHLTLFPAAIISLLMISFNMFGNGLRDALNPSQGVK